MSVSLSDLAPITVTPDGGVETTCPVFNISLPYNLALLHQRHSGGRFRRSTVHAGGNPVLTATMPARFALDTFGLGLTKLTDLKVYLSTYSDGERQTGSNHSYLQASTGGFAVIESISANHRGLATASVRIIPIASSDVADPFSRTDSAALPTLSSEPVLNTLGPIDIAGTVTDGLQSVTVSLNPLLTPVSSDGRRYPREVLYQGGNPSISGQHIGPLALESSVGFEGIITTSTTSVYFRENDATNRTLKATGIEIQMGDGVMTLDNIGASQDSAAQSNFTIVGRSTSDTHPLTYTASAAVAT